MNFDRKSNRIVWLAAPALALTIIAVASGGAPEQARCAEPAAYQSDNQSRDKILELWEKVRLDHAASRPVDPSIAMQMLTLASGLPASDALLRTNVEAFFSKTVWDPLVSSALLDRHEVAIVETELSKAIDGWNSRLQAGGVPPCVASLGLLHLGIYQSRKELFDHLRQTLDRLEATINDPSVWIGFQAMFFNLRGMAETDRSNYAVALECYDTALGLCRQAGLPVDEAQSLNNLGLLELKVGDYAAAQPLLERSVKLYAAAGKGDSEPAILANLDLALAIEGSRDFSRAAGLLQQLIARQKSMPDEIAFLCFNNQALLEYSEGDFAQAKELFTRAKALAVKVFGGPHLHTAEIDLNLGWVEYALGNPAAAERDFAAAADLLQQNYADNPRTAEALGYLGRLQVANGNRPAGRATIERALQLREQRLAQIIAAPLPERDRLALVQELRVHPESISWPGCFDTYLELAPKLNISAADQYAHLLIWKGALTRESRQVYGNNFAAAQLLAQQLAGLRRKLQLLRGSDQPNVTNNSQEIGKWQSEMDGLQFALAKLQVPPSYSAPLLPRDIAAALSKMSSASALLDIIEVRRFLPRPAGQNAADDRVYVAFLVRPNGSVQRLEFAEPAGSIDASINGLVSQIQNGFPSQDQAVDLSDALGDHFRAQLAGIKLLVVAADGAFHRLPWGALPGAAADTYWIEQVTFAGVPSAQSLVRRASRLSQPADGNWLACGGIDFGPMHAGGPKWRALPNTLAEATAVDAVFKSSSKTPTVDQPTLVTGIAATKGQFCELMKSRKYLHVATHGFFMSKDADAYAVFDNSAQLDSALVMAGTNATASGTDDCLLSADEIGWLDLSGVRLFTLSACESGLGQVRAGQGAIGLVGALDQAGVETVVSSLWKIDDPATADLMVAFYKHLANGFPQFNPAVAFRRAQLDMIAKGRKSGKQQPYFWAGWSVSGDPGHIER